MHTYAVRADAEAALDRAVERDPTDAERCRVIEAPLT